MYSTILLSTLRMTYTIFEISKNKKIVYIYSKTKPRSERDESTIKRMDQNNSIGNELCILSIHYNQQKLV